MTKPTPVNDTNKMNIDRVRKYFIARAKEVQRIVKDGTPWSFVCATVLLECLSKIVAGRDNGSRGYKNFIRQYLAKLDIRYADFTYKTGKRDLPEQMYHILRCGIVHSFSFVPDQRAKQQGGRLRSIILCHKKESIRRKLTHLSNYSLRGADDAALLVAEEFTKDLIRVVALIFDNARSDRKLRENILQWMQQHPPLSGKF